MKKGVKYLPEFVYGGTDGAITTFAVVAGVIGASLSSSIVLILGFANLFADGFSMAVSNYLSSKSSRDISTKHVKRYHIRKNPINSALVTFVSFLIVGFIPLLSFVLAIFIPSIAENQVNYSIALTAVAFLVVGAVKGSVTKRNCWYSSLETLVIGGVAAGLAFIVGYLLRGLVG